MLAHEPTERWDTKTRLEADYWTKNEVRKPVIIVIKKHNDENSEASSDHEIEPKIETETETQKEPYKHGTFLKQCYKCVSRDVFRYPIKDRVFLDMVIDYYKNLIFNITIYIKN